MRDLCELLGFGSDGDTGNRTGKEGQFQTPDHNLNEPNSGPKIRDHFTRGHKAFASLEEVIDLMLVAVVFQAKRNWLTIAHWGRLLKSLKPYGPCLPSQSATNLK